MKQLHTLFVGTLLVAVLGLAAAGDAHAIAAGELPGGGGLGSLTEEEIAYQVDPALA